MTILIFVPRQDVQGRLTRALHSAQFVVTTANSGAECIEALGLMKYDAVLVDSDSLIFEDAILLAKAIRGVSSVIGLFVLVRYHELEERLRLLEAGADDCVREPFFATEVAVRLQLLIQLREAATTLLARSHVIRAGELELNLVRRTVCRAGRSIELRPKEFLLLEYLVRNANRMLTRAALLEGVWNSPIEGLTNVVEVHISSLRSKIDRGFNEKLIRTTRGMGYTLLCHEESPSPLQVGRLSEGAPMNACLQRFRDRTD